VRQSDMHVGLLHIAAVNVDSLDGQKHFEFKASLNTAMLLSVPKHSEQETHQ